MLLIDIKLKICGDEVGISALCFSGSSCKAFHLTTLELCSRPAAEHHPGCSLNVI